MPWSHVIELIEKLDDAQLRDWYSAKNIAQSWSRPILTHHSRFALSRYDLSPTKQAVLPAEDALARAVALELGSGHKTEFGLSI